MGAAGRLKLWISGVGGIGLALGVLLGLSWSELRAHAAQHAQDPWLARFCEKYGLDREQEDQVRAIRRARERDHRRIYAQNFDNLSAAARAQLETANRRADDRIEAILDAAQRRLYRQDRESGPEPQAAPKDGSKNR